MEELCQLGDVAVLLQASATERALADGAMGSVLQQLYIVKNAEGLLFRNRHEDDTQPLKRSHRFSTRPADHMAARQSEDIRAWVRQSDSATQTHKGIFRVVALR